MKNRILSRIMLISSFVFVLLSITVLAELSSSSVSMIFLNQAPDPARAGDVLEVRFRLENKGRFEAKDIWVELVPEYPFNLFYDDIINNEVDYENALQVIPSLPGYPSEEASKTVLFKLRINRDAVEGNYKLKARLSLDQGQSWITQEYNISIKSGEFAEIKIDKTKIMPGKETELIFTINNNGNSPLRDIVFSWSEAKGIILPIGSDNTRYVKYLEAGSTAQVKYNVVASVNANPDLYSLNINIEYGSKNESGGVGKNKLSKTAGIFVGGETDFDVTFSESSQGQTSLSLANIGNNRALSVTVRIPPQDGFSVQGSTSSIVGNLDKGDYTVVSFQIQQNSRMNLTRNASSAGRQTARQQSQQQPLAQLQRENNLLVFIDYTDTSGERHSVEKKIPIQFKAQPSTNGIQTGRNSQFGMHETSSLWSKPAFIVLVMLVVLALFILLYYKKRKLVNPLLAELLNKIRSKKKLI